MADTKTNHSSTLPRLSLQTIFNQPSGEPSVISPSWHMKSYCLLCVCVILEKWRMGKRQEQRGEDPKDEDFNSSENISRISILRYFFFVCIIIRLEMEIFLYNSLFSCYRNVLLFQALSLVYSSLALALKKKKKTPFLKYLINFKNSRSKKLCAKKRLSPVFNLQRFGCTCSVHSWELTCQNLLSHCFGFEKKRVCFLLVFKKISCFILQNSKQN